MDTNSPMVGELPTLTPETTPQKQLESSPTTNPTTTPVLASDDSKLTPPTVTPRPLHPPSTATATATATAVTYTNLIYIPTYSRWFSWNDIHECEVRFLPEFFDGRSPSKNPRVYKYCRNSIIRKFRENPTGKITFTEARKTVIGDVGSVRRVFDFLEAWGLINYSPAPASKLPLKWEDKETKFNTPAPLQGTEPAGNSAESVIQKKRLCSGCKTLCSIACFASDKHDLTLCARCYVRGNYRVGVSNNDFRRVEIDEETKTDWTDKETLLLLEAIMHYGDDWKKVAEYVGGRSEIECVARFIKLPFGEQFVGPSDSTDEVNKKLYQTKDQNDAESGLQSFEKTLPNKRICLNPLADASNPIMAQAAFLSALAGVEVAEVSARSAVRALSEFNYGAIKDRPVYLSSQARKQGPDATSNGDTTLKTLEGPNANVQSQLEEEQDLESAISCIAEVQMKEILDKILSFEKLESQMEREWQQLQQMKNMLFVDRLNLLFGKTPAQKAGESMQQDVKTG